MESNDVKKNTTDTEGKDALKKGEIETFLRSVDTRLLQLLPFASIQDLEFMEDILSLMMKNIQTRKSFLIRFHERDLFDSSADDSKDSHPSAPIAKEPVPESRPMLPPRNTSEIEFDVSEPRPAPVQKEEKVVSKPNNPTDEAIRTSVNAVLPQERDDRIKFYQVTELPKNYLPVISSSVPEQLVNNRHYMIPALLDNIAFYTYGACATCTVAECKNCQKLKNPKNGVRAELKMFLLSNQEVTVIAFNKVASEGLRIPHDELVQMVKQNRDRTNSGFLSLYMGHPFVFDKCFKGKPVEEKEVTNQFYALAPECLGEYHKKLQI